MSHQYGSDDWYGGMNDYLLGSEEVLKQALNGKPIDIYQNTNEENDGLTNILFSAIAGIITAFVTTNGYKKAILRAFESVKIFEEGNK